MLSKLFAKRVDDSLGGHGSIGELVRKADISRQTLDRWIRGERIPDLSQVERVAAALGKSPIELLFPGEIPRAQPNEEEIIDRFLELVAKITQTRPARVALREALLAALENARSSDKA